MATRTWTGSTDGDLNKTANWKEAAIPVNGDDIIIGADAVNSMDTNMATLAAVHPATVRIGQGFSSSLSIGASGSPLELDYVESYLIFDAPATEAWIEFKNASSASPVIVNGTGSGANALHLDSAAGGISLSLLTGKATIDAGAKLNAAISVGASSTATDAQLTISSSVTFASTTQIMQYGGTIVSSSGSSTLSLISLGGTATFSGTAQLWGFWGHGGALIYNSSANMTDVRVQKGTFNASGSPGFSIVTTCEVYDNVIFNIANGLRNILIPNGIKMHGTPRLIVDGGRVLTPGS